LLDLARNREVSCIIVKDFSRFGRQYIQVGDYLEQIFPFLGIRFISVTDNYDSNRQECGAGSIDVAFKHIMHAYYVKDISQKIKTARRIQIEQGRFLSAYAIFGYKKSSDKHKLEIDEPAAAIVRRIFNLIIQGNSTGETARILNSDEVPTPNIHKQNTGCTRNWNFINNTNQWTETMVYRIVTDIRYTGCVVGGKSFRYEPGNPKVKYQRKETWVISAGMHEAIISTSDYEKARNRIKIRKKSDSVIENRSRRLPCKLICATCGHVLAKNGYSLSYFCRYSTTLPGSRCFAHPIKETDLDTAIAASLQVQINTLTDAGQIKKRYRLNDSNINAIKTQIAQINRQIDKLKSSRRSIYEKYADEIITREDYLNQRNIFDSEIEALTDKLSNFENTLINAERSSTDNPMFKILSDIRLGDKISKEVADALIEKVLVYDANRIEIVWKSTNEIMYGGHE